MHLHDSLYVILIVCVVLFILHEILLLFMSDLCLWLSSLNSILIEKVTTIFPPSSSSPLRCFRTTDSCTASSWKWKFIFHVFPTLIFILLLFIVYGLLHKTISSSHNNVEMVEISQFFNFLLEMGNFPLEMGYFPSSGMFNVSL